LEKIQNEILAAVKKITMTKEKSKTEPSYALSIDVFRTLNNERPITLEEYKTAVNELVKKGKLVFGHTLNNVYLKIKK